MRPVAEDRNPRTPSAIRPAADPQTILLGQITTEGTVGMFRVLRRATEGDPGARGLQASAVVRALPGMGALAGHEVLRRAHISDTRSVGELDVEQRVALCRLVTGMQRLRHATG